MKITTAPTSIEVNPPLPDNEAMRLQALYQSKILDTPAEKAFDEITALAAHICHVPIATISLIDAQRQWFKSKIGIVERDTPRNVAFCRYTILQSEILIVPDTFADPRFANHPAVIGEPYIRFYAGVPLTTVEGYAIGSLCIADRIVRELAPEQIESLRLLASQVVNLIELRRNLGNLDRSVVKHPRDRQQSKQFFKNIAVGFGLISATLLTISAISYHNLTRLIQNYHQTTHSHQVLEKLEAVISQVKDVETGQRGYVITGIDDYLEPYNVAVAVVEQRLEELRYVTAAEPQHQVQLRRLEDLIRQRIVVSRQIVALRKQEGFESAKQLTLTGTGKALMDEIRATVRAISTVENANLATRSRLLQSTTRKTSFTFTSGILLNFSLLSAVYYLVYRENKQRRQTEIVLEQERDFTTAVMNTSGALVVVLDLQGRIVRFNAACEQLTGYSLAEVQGKTIWESFIPDAELPGVKATVQKLSAGEFPNQHENFWITRSGDRRLISWSNTTLLDQQGSVEYIIATGIDITDKKQVEIALQQTNALQSAILNSTNYIIISTDIHGTIYTFNHAAQQLLGYSAADAIAKMTPANFHDENEIAQRAQELSAEIGTTISPGFDVFVAKARRGALDEREWSYIRKDGSRFPVLLTVTALHDQEGQITGFLNIGSDITARKQAQQALKESETTLRLALEAAQMGTWDWNLHKNHVTYSEQLGAIFGFPPGRRHATYEDFLKIIHPEDRGYVEQNVTRALEEGAEYNLEFRVIWSDGSIRWVGSQGQVYCDITTKATRMVGVTTDITQRKQTEHALKQANEKLTNWVEELEERNREITLLGEMSEILQACHSVEEAYIALPTLIQPLFPQLAGGIFLINASRNMVEAVAQWGDSPIDSHALFRSDDCWALRRGRVHWVENIQTGLLCQHFGSAHLKSAEHLCVPMMAQGEALGLLHLNSTESGQITAAKRQLAVTVAEHIGWALANLKLRAKLQHHSIRDSLTNLFNRRYMEESLEREIFRCDRKHQSLGVIMIDVDHFKRFNDTFGHEAGDAVLREIGLFLQKSIRKSDIACRYGGEELTLILPESPLEVVHQRAEQICEGVKHLHLQHRQQSLSTVTLSLGVACFPQHGLSPEALLQAADAALYRAKAAGRDRVEIA